MPEELDEFGLPPICPCCNDEGYVLDPEGLDNPDGLMPCPCCNSNG